MYHGVHTFHGYDKEKVMPAERVELRGHIIDSLTLAKVLDLIITRGAEYTVVEIDIGKTQLDPSRVLLEVGSDDPELLQSLLIDLHSQGANRLETQEATLEPCAQDGVLPEDFYSTTNLPTKVLVSGKWLEVEYPEMDCAIVIDSSSLSAGDTPQATAVPMHKVRTGDMVVVGDHGVVVEPIVESHESASFHFMSSQASSEKPKRLIVAKVAERIMATRQLTPPGDVLAVCGPAAIHTGAGQSLARLIRDGWITMLFAGNGFATHDLESNILGTSLGVSLREGNQTESGHSNHLRVINEIRKLGSIQNAVEKGYLKSGVLYECVVNGVPYVLGGSLRDDGPLPDVMTDVVQATDRMRELRANVNLAIMLATTLHAIAVGNILSSKVETFCVDINQAVVTKLSDRGSHQTVGIVTDVGLFISELADILSPQA
jgi:lysine-ketoglutarate reductase/saccharopine dehydrogenase-like protein (TIGR00300 family)